MYCSLCLLAGFIDFIVEPTFSGLIDTTEKVIGPLIEEERKAKETGNRRSRYYYYHTSSTARLIFPAVFWCGTGFIIMEWISIKLSSLNHQCNCVWKHEWIFPFFPTIIKDMSVKLLSGHLNVQTRSIITLFLLNYMNFDPCRFYIKKKLLLERKVS